MRVELILVQFKILNIIKIYFKILISFLWVALWVFKFEMIVKSSSNELLANDHESTIKLFDSIIVSPSSICYLMCLFY